MSRCLKSKGHCDRPRWSGCGRDYRQFSGDADLALAAGTERRTWTIGMRRMWADARRAGAGPTVQRAGADRKSTRLTPVTNAHLVCRLLLEKKKCKDRHEITESKTTT